MIALLLSLLPPPSLQIITDRTLTLQVLFGSHERCRFIVCHWSLLDSASCADSSALAMPSTYPQPSPREFIRFQLAGFVPVDLTDSHLSAAVEATMGDAGLLASLLQVTIPES